MQVTRKELTPSTFVPFVVRIKVTSEKDVKILKSLFARMIVVPEFLAKESHLSGWGVTTAELHDFMTEVEAALDPVVL